jgi:hypothetical protein
MGVIHLLFKNGFAQGMRWQDKKVPGKNLQTLYKTTAY